MKQALETKRRRGGDGDARGKEKDKTEEGEKDELRIQYYRH